MEKVLVTGAAGAVGVPVCRELLSRGYHVRAFDLGQSPCGSEVVRGDIGDSTALDRAVDGVGAVVHLAAQAHDRPFEELVVPNVMGLYRVMDACRQAQTRRVVLASTIQVVGKRDDTGKPAAVNQSAPSNHYALTKVWAEQMGAMYSRRFGLSVICVRIAWMVRNREEAEKMHAWQRQELYLSQDDVGRFMALAVAAQNISFAVVYAASKGGEKLWDMEPAKTLLGYEARDTFPEGLGFPFP